MLNNVLQDQQCYDHFVVEQRQHFGGRHAETRGRVMVAGSRRKQITQLQAERADDIDSAAAGEAFQ